MGRGHSIPSIRSGVAKVHEHSRCQRSNVLFAFLIVAVIFLSMLSACSNVPLSNSPSNISASKPGIKDVSGRPDIPRKTPPQDTPENPIYKVPAEQPEPTRPVLVPARVSSSDLDVPVGDRIGTHFPVITAKEFPLLKHSPIRVNNNQLLSYTEELFFDFGINSTGVVEFGKDDRTRSIGTFLRFERNKPVFAYRVTLERGSFESLQGRDIQLLGHVYTIAQANNRSVTLYGKNVASNLFFDDGDQLTVNSSARSGTICSVKPNIIAFELFAKGRDSGDVLLGMNETLSSNVGQMKLASDLFDIRYQGSPVLETTRIDLTRTSSFGYVLTFDVGSKTAAAAAPTTVTIPLVEQDAGKLYLGTTDQPLRVTSCSSSNSYCIAPDTKLALTAIDGSPLFVRYDGATDNPRTIMFSDMNKNRYTFDYVGTPGQGAAGTITFGKNMYRVQIGAYDNATDTYNVSVDQGFRNGRIDFLTRDGTIIRINDIVDNTTLPLDIIIPGARTLDKRDQTTRINITYAQPSTTRTSSTFFIAVDMANNVTFVSQDDVKDTIGQTKQGMVIMLKRGDGSLPLNIGDDATFIIPKTQAYGIVSLEE